MKRIAIFLVGIVLLSFSILQATAFAQSQPGFNLTISPTFLDLMANPGDVLKQKFRVRNNTNDPIVLSIVVDKLDPHARNGEVIPVAPQPNDTFTSWISFDTATPTAKPKEWVDVPFTITVPKTAAFGYYYALRIGPSKTNSGQNGPGAKLIGQIVLPVLLNVASPDAKSELRLVSFTPTSFFNEYLPVTFKVQLQNTGNVHIKPSGNIFIRLAGNDNAVLSMNKEGGIILPGSTRTYETNWLDGFFVKETVLEDGSPKVDKNGHIMTHLVINWNQLTRFRIGKYTASALVVYDNGKRDVPLEATTTFWVFPYTLVLGTFGVLLLVGLLLRGSLTWYITHEVKKQQNR